MKPITSFTIDHMKLFPGIYVSRKDMVGSETITSFDIRMTRPNFDHVLSTGEIHAAEHLGATYLRNHDVFGEKIIYFGPMGCRTGFYLLLAGDYDSKDIVPFLQDTFEFIKDYEGDIPGATKEDCGNCTDMDLAAAKKSATTFYNDVLKDIKEDRLVYPN